MRRPAPSDLSLSRQGSLRANSHYVYTRSVAVCLREVTVDPGTSLVTQGDNAYELFVIEAVGAKGRSTRPASPSAR